MSPPPPSNIHHRQITRHNDDHLVNSKKKTVKKIKTKNAPVRSVQFGVERERSETGDAMIGGRDVMGQLVVVVQLWRVLLGQSHPALVSA
jgi:hypothetical protein